MNTLSVIGLPAVRKPVAISLFSGIGGLDLAFSLAGFDIVAQVEIDAFCQKILAKHAPEYWPNAVIFEDVKNVGRHNLPYGPDVIFGGFPCTDISNAGKRAGIKEGTRSGLWIEFARIIGEIRPRVVFLENVAAITGRDGVRVVADLAALGYDAQWRVIPASAVGAPHERKRWWCVAIRRDSVADTYLTGSSSIGGVGQTREIGAGDAGPSGELAYPQRTEWRSQNSEASSLVRDGSISGRQENAGDTGSGSPELAHTESGIFADQQSLPDQQTLVSTVIGASSRTGSGDTPTGVQVRIGNELDSTEHVVNSESEGLSIPEQSGFARSVAQSETGLVVGPERSGRANSELGDTQSIGREGNRSAGQQFTDTRSGQGLSAGTDSRGGSNGDGRDAQRGLGRILDGISNRLDLIRRQSQWPSRPGQPQWDWEPPRTIRKQRHRPARLKALGNAVVWQVAAPIAEAIYSYLEETDRLAGEEKGNQTQDSASSIIGGTPS